MQWEKKHFWPARSQYWILKLCSNIDVIDFLIYAVGRQCSGGHHFFFARNGMIIWWCHFPLPFDDYTFWPAAQGWTFCHYARSLCDTLGPVDKIFTPDLLANYCCLFVRSLPWYCITAVLAKRLTYNNSFLTSYHAFNWAVYQKVNYRHNETIFSARRKGRPSSFSFVMVVHPINLNRVI